MKNYINFDLINPRYLAFNFFICLMILAPNFKVYNLPTDDFIIDKITIIILVTLFSLSLLPTFTFRLSSLLIIISNTIFLHITNIWGVWGLSERISVAIESPADETIEYLYNYMGYHDALIVVYAIACFYFSLRIRPLIKSNTAFLLLPLLLIIISVALISRSERIDDYPITGIALEAWNTFDRAAEVKSRQATLENIRLDVHKCEHIYDTVIIVIGESVYKDRMGIYGYPKNTTPFLKSIKPYVFDAISPVNVTKYSVPMLLTQARVSDFKVFFTSPSVISHFNKCGYKTSWISNQSRLGKHDTYVSSISAEAHRVNFFNETSFISEPDEKLLPEIEKTFNLNDEKKAIFIHLRGSHFNYSTRYPSDFPKVKTNTRQEEYDTSIQYTDLVLSKIFNVIPNKSKSLIVYVADHGEVVTDNKAGHGYNPAYKDEYRIPFIIWSHDKPRIRDIVEAANGKTINAESLYDTIMYSTGISSSLNLSYKSKVHVVSDKNSSDYLQLKFHPDNILTRKNFNSSQYRSITN